MKQSRFSRIRTFIITLKSYIAETDPSIIHFGGLSQINQQLSGLVDQLNNYRANFNITNLGNALSNIDNAIGQLGTISLHASSKSQKMITEDLSSFKKTISQYLKNIEVKYDELSTKYLTIKSESDHLKKTIETQINRLDEAVSRYEKMFSESEDRRRNEFSSNLKDQLVRYEELKEEMKMKSNELIVNAKKNIENVESSTKKIVDELFIDLEDKKEQAENIVNAIASTGMTGGFQKVANNAEESKKRWQKLTVFSLAGLISFAIIAFFGTIEPTFQLGKFGARAFVALSFAILAAYAAKQADKNSEIEKKNRKLELEFASIEPYLSKLPIDKQNLLKEKLAEKWFAQNDEQIAFKELEKTHGNMIDVFKMFLEYLPKLK